MRLDAIDAGGALAREGSREEGREGQTEVVLKGRYRLLGTLGRGAMGTVFLAHDSVMDRRVAVKVLCLPQGLAATAREEAVQRFYREARLAGKLMHPNIVATFDIDRHGECHFITMELMEGKTLASILEEEGALEESEALRVALQVCRALKCAHAQGVVHRDIKPGNIFVSKEGEVKVGDFGIARSMDAATLTQTGYSMGTPQNMSPEQVRGDPLDPRSDLFSLGVVLYEMLSGKNPFAADSPPKAIYNILERRPSLDAEHGIHHPKVREILERALSKDASGRYADAKEMAFELDNALASFAGPLSGEAPGQVMAAAAEEGPEAGSTPVARGEAGLPSSVDEKDRLPQVVGSIPVLRDEGRSKKPSRAGKRKKGLLAAAILIPILFAGAALAVTLLLLKDGGENKQSRPHPMKAVEAFLSALKDGDLQRASNLLSPRAKEEVDLDALSRKLLDRGGSAEITSLEGKVLEERERVILLEVWAKAEGKRVSLGTWVLYWSGERWLVEKPGIPSYASGG